MKRTPLRSGTKGLTRTGSLPRRTRLAPVNRKRAGHRFPKGVCEPLREYVRGLPCVIGWMTWNLASPCRGTIQCAHLKTRGSGGADRGNVFSLCVAHHDLQHRMGVKSFQRDFGLDLPAICRAITEDFEAASPGSLQGDKRDR